jgi:hypothetical protein
MLWNIYGEKGDLKRWKENTESKEKFSLVYAFFWVIPLRLSFICQHFGTLCPIFVGRYEDGTDRVF